MTSNRDRKKKQLEDEVYISQESIDALGEHIEMLSNTGGPKAIEEFCRTHKFTGHMEGMKWIGGTGCNRIALGNRRVILKVVREPRAVYQNKFEVWLMKNCKSEQMLKHMPELYAHSRNYHVTATRRLTRSITPNKEMLQSEDYKIFKELGLGDDIHNNNTWWDGQRNTWVIVDLGIPSSSRWCYAAIQNLKQGKHISHNFEPTYEDHCK